MNVTISREDPRGEEGSLLSIFHRYLFFYSIYNGRTNLLLL